MKVNFTQKYKNALSESNVYKAEIEQLPRFPYYSAEGQAFYSKLITEQDKINPFGYNDAVVWPHKYVPDNIVIQHTDNRR